MDKEIQIPELKKVPLWRRHWVLFTVLVVILVSSLFVRGGSVKVRCTAADGSYEEIRLDYSIYGYLINVRPEIQDSRELAAQLGKEMLFMSMDESVLYLADNWSAENEGAVFKYKVKGYTYKTTARRDKLIETVKGQGYTAEVLF
ncbi:MAG: hypothetical protein IJN42_04500 [Clostridia bacterium]|nr:hypothetical protein [Clostridia bacterium]